MSDSVRPHGLQSTRLLRPWDSPGKNTGVGCHFLLQCMKVKVKSFSHVRLLATPWTAAYQAPPFIGFSGQQYWSRVPLPSPVDIYYTISTCILRCEAIIFPSTLIKNFTEVLFGLGIILTVSFLWGFWEDSYTTSPLPPSSLKVFSYFLKE